MRWAKEGMVDGEAIMRHTLFQTSLGVTVAVELFRR
jgi:hypothetical protein